MSCTLAGVTGLGSEVVLYVKLDIHSLPTNTGSPITCRGAEFLLLRFAGYFGRICHPEHVTAIYLLLPLFTYYERRRRYLTIIAAI